MKSISWNTKLQFNWLFVWFQPILMRAKSCCSRYVFSSFLRKASVGGGEKVQAWFFSLIKHDQEFIIGQSVNAMWQEILKANKQTEFYWDEAPLFWYSFLKVSGIFKEILRGEFPKTNLKREDFSWHDFKNDKK